MIHSIGQWKPVTNGPCLEIIFFCLGYNNLTSNCLSHGHHHHHHHLIKLIKLVIKIKTKIGFKIETFTPFSRTILPRGMRVREIWQTLGVTSYDIHKELLCMIIIRSYFVLSTYGATVYDRHWELLCWINIRNYFVPMTNIRSYFAWQT